jgi:hypothetical protein
MMAAVPDRDAPCHTGTAVNDLSSRIDAAYASEADVLDMVARFEACTLPYERWTHRAHVAVAVSYLRDLPFDEALDRIRQHIQLYNRACGDPSGYHETITVLFLRRLASALDARPQGEDLAEAVEALAAAFDMRWPLLYYSKARLWSAEARRKWIEPDLRPLEF